MPILNDLTRLFDHTPGATGLPQPGQTYLPGNGPNSGTTFGQMRDGTQIDLADPNQIAAGDTLHWGGKEYEVTQLFQAELTWIGVNGGVEVRFNQNFIIQVADPADPSKTMMFWIPQDYTLPQNAVVPGIPQAALQGTAGSLEFISLTPITQIEWVRVQYNDVIDAVCFSTDALIETQSGLVAAGDLAVGDLVWTRDAGCQPIRWIGKRALSAEELAHAPHLCPIRIRAGALGANTPQTDLVVSPQHRMLIRSKIALRMFGAQEVLIAAQQLLGIEGVEEATDLASVTYVHILLDSHQIIHANGAEAESLFTGEQALRSVGPAAMDEILALFPELAETGFLPAPARPLIPGRAARHLAERHAQNLKPLFEATAS
ncbi:Hint domain-containing protein [Paracoccus aminophilus]|nr:Hint domain-containing protein [Paracoccus aminophilus]